ncbi:MAG: small, acid-soluble spore protein, alpha/beta type [Lachnospiraceae bacterium]|nr:small, acid-soluble spore protein, alpha/beta type [Lachnospiraceae bacterium]
MKKKKPIVLEELSKEELLKYEIAKELGLFDRVMQNGWGSLSAKETGRIGGILAKRRNRERQDAKNAEG